MLLSVVIVAKNEERNIARCIESTLSCTEGLKDKEVLLVDSCSSDRTVEIAKQYPINIVQLGKDWPHSPSAGRFTGVNNSRGKYILIIDGDMELQKGWVESALEFMEANLKSAATVGMNYHRYLQKDGSYSEPQLGKASEKKYKFEKIDYVFGSSMFRRNVLLEVGNFHPYLRAEEEAEISYRIKKKGYDLFFSPIKATYHYCIPTNTFQETLRRKQKKLWAGLGDMLSWCLRKRCFFIIWKRFKLYIFFLSYMLTSVVGIIFFAIFHKFSLSIVFGAMPFLYVLYMCVKKKNAYYGLLSVLNISVISMSLIGGLFRKVDEISNYPTDVLWVKRV